MDDKFSKPFNSFLGEDAVLCFINSKIEESKYCGDVIKKHLNKELVMTKMDNEYFKNPIKCSICDNIYDDRDVKVRNHCHATGKYRGFAQRYCNMKVKINHKITVVFYSLKKYSHLITQAIQIQF